MPLHWPRDQISVFVRPDDLKNRHRWQTVWIAIRLLGPHDLAAVFQLAQDLFEVDARSTFDPERLGDIAFG